MFNALDALSPRSTAASATTATGASASPGSAASRAGLNTDQFLKILTAEISHQNPLDPMSNSDFLGQLTQMQQLQTSAGLADTLTNLLKFQEIGAAGGLLGRTVRAVADDDTSVSGPVERVVVNGSDVRLIVGGRPVALANIKELQP